MKKIIIAAGLAAALAAGIFVFKARGAQVDVVHPKITPAVQAIYATGTVEAVQMISISPKMSARLMELYADEGKRVQKGEVLAQLEDSDTQQTLAEAQAQFLVAEKELARSTALSKTGAIAKSALDQAQATFDSAKATVERTRAELSYLKLLAPEDGTIIRRDGEIGEMLAANTPVFWMIGGDQMRIETEVDEEDISLIQPGQRVVIGADAFPGQVFEGSVLSITPKGDPVARSYRVRVAFDKNAALMIGMTAETNIITQEKDQALMVPNTALSNGHVMIVDGGKAKTVAVETGIKTQQAVEITSGVAEGAKVLKKFDATLDQKSVSDRLQEWSTDTLKKKSP